MPRRPDPLAPFHPLVRRWFTERLGAPSAPQREGWPAIASGSHTLILAPTGTGKTLAAFLWEVNALIVDGIEGMRLSALGAQRSAPATGLATKRGAKRAAEATGSRTVAGTGGLPNAVRILYVSPLKALSNDVQRNLEMPLDELRQRFEAAGKPFPEIRIAVRTGDTPASARARMVRRSPHILITTPESLHIMLTSTRARTMFSGVRAVIIDEIHAVAGTKRGAHLALALERLDTLLERPAQRIGLSATQRPLEETARFLGGVEVPELSALGARPEERLPAPGSRLSATEPLEASGASVPPEASAESTRPPSAGTRPRAESAVAFRPVRVVDCGSVKKMELAVVSPVPDLSDVGGTVWPAVAKLALKHVREARTTLVFVNNRAQAERIAARINDLAGEPLAHPYHGSLSRERRAGLERALKAGELRALVTTSSLELGIDIGSVDVVLQLQSPKRVSAGLQRVGRAGHSLEAVSRGVIVPTFNDDALESTAIAGAMRAGEVEPTRVVQNALDVLAQTIVAAASVDDWDADALFRLVRRAYPYHRLSRAAFDETLGMLAGKYSSEVASELDPKIGWDRVANTITAPRASRMAAVISGGTIPDRGLYAVQLPDRTRLGELDEEFVHESRVGDAFQLGSSTWRIMAIEHDRVIVQPAPGAPARMPFWHGEFMARGMTVTPRVGALRRELADARTMADLERLAAEHGTDLATVQSLAEYCAAQRASTGIVPDERTVLVEHFRDETGAVRVVLHAPFGGRVTAPWGMALAQRAREALGAGDPASVDVQVQTTDDGIMLRLPDLRGDPPIGALLGLSPAEAERRVTDEIGTTPLFGARFRMNAARALVLSRGSPRRRMPLWLQRLKALDLLDAVRAHPTFPLLVETYREVLQDAFDVEGMRTVLARLERGEIETRTVRTETPSPFARSLQFGFVIDWMYADDTPRAERRAALMSVDQALLDDVMGSEHADEDDTRAVLLQLAAERAGTAEGRRARSADELLVLLDRAGDLSLEELRARVAGAGEGTVGDPLGELLGSGRALLVPFRAATAGDEARAWRAIPTDAWSRYAAAFGAEAMSRVRVRPRVPVGRSAEEELVERDAAEVVPEHLRTSELPRGAAQREILARHVSAHGPVTVRELRERYGFHPASIEGWLLERQRMGKLVAGRFRPGISEREWAPRRLVEVARRRALAALRKSIEPVELPVYARFLQRWQHVDPRDRLEGLEGVRRLFEQLQGLPRPGSAWEREYLPARLAKYESTWLSQLAAQGSLVWAAEGKRDDAGAAVLSAVRLIERGTGRLWLREPDRPEQLSEAARAAHDALVRQGASFLADLQAASGLSGLALREALRELAAAGLVTNDTIEAMREVVRARPLPPDSVTRETDASRWLPTDFTPSPGRPVVQRRPNLRRLPKWRRPDRDAAGGWVGRWAPLRTPGTMGGPIPDDEAAERIARQWLERYGVVARDWWLRERPAIAWRAIYHELRRLEFRGEVRRGYFVRGLAGAQFALPDAVERLREPLDTDEPMVAFAASDPANPYSLKVAAEHLPPLARPRGGGGVLVTRAGRPVLLAEGRGRRVNILPDLPAADVERAAHALVRHLLAAPSSLRRSRDVEIRRINGAPASTSPHAEAFARAGFRRGSGALRYLEKLA